MVLHLLLMDALCPALMGVQLVNWVMLICVDHASPAILSIRHSSVGSVRCIVQDLAIPKISPNAHTVAWMSIMMRATLA